MVEPFNWSGARRFTGWSDSAGERRDIVGLTAKHRLLKVLSDLWSNLRRRVAYV